MNINVLEMGAVGDGVTIDTKAIQSAIDKCSQSGGGRVLLEGGHVFRAGSICLKSNVNLHLEKGAILKASDNMHDFDLFGKYDPAFIKKGIDVPTYVNCEYDGLPVLYYIYCKGQENVSITGEGIIDGNEEVFYGKVTKYHIEGSFYPRVPLMYIENVKNFTLTECTLTHSGFWTVHLVGCQDVLVDGIRILNNLRLANCDGIDPDHCQNVRISNCHIEAGDDGIVFKNTAQKMAYGNCENITVTNCTIISTSAAIKFGTETEAEFKNITISNINISRSNRGISMMLRDKGSIENIIFSNITIDTRIFSKDHWWGQSEPIAITALKRNAETDIKYIKNIIFDNIIATSENGIFIYGEKDMNLIEDISFNHVRLNLKNKTHYEKGFCDLRPSNIGGHVNTGLNGMYIRNASEVNINDFKVHVDPELAEQYIKDINPPTGLVHVQI